MLLDKTQNPVRVGTVIKLPTTAVAPSFAPHDEPDDCERRPMTALNRRPGHSGIWIDGRPFQAGSGSRGGSMELLEQECASRGLKPGDSRRKTGAA